MAVFDKPLEELQVYLPPRDEPADFDAFWKTTLDETRQHDLNPRFERVDYGLKTIESFDVTFAGYGGQPIKGWLMLPRDRREPLACVVDFIGYGGGRGFPIDWLGWASIGFANLVMDTRGQGSNWRAGDTPDIPSDGTSPFYPGFMTQGILDPKTYYYRRLYADTVRAIETAQSHPAVDPDRIAATGGSQGGGLTLAATGLSPAVKVAMTDVPFMCHWRRATEITDTYPYQEIVRYCKCHRDHIDTVFQTLSYFDGLNLAARSSARALFSVGLMDDTCPPSTVFAAYNHYAGPKEIRIWPYNKHEGGESYQALEKMRFLLDIWG